MDDEFDKVKEFDRVINSLGLANRRRYSKNITTQTFNISNDLKLDEYILLTP
jgi:hypothetical protein